jgi:EmrB/QacA subfamily drug resistance transporter
VTVSAIADSASGPAAVAPAGSSLTPLRSPTGVALIAGTVLASGVASYDAFVVNVAVPAISHRFGAGVAAIQWTLTSYLLAVAALLLIAGALADRFGRRRVLLIGLGVMAVASLLCASASSMNALIASRAVQGIGAALVVPTSLALLNGSLRVSDRARGIGVWAGLSTLATTAGPFFGGWLVDHASWRWVFLVNLPLIALALLALRRVPETSGERRSLSLDAVGALLAVAGLGGVIYALTDGASAGWTSPRVLIAGVVGALSLVALAPAERRRRAPMLRLSLFASRQLDAINDAASRVGGVIAVALVPVLIGVTAGSSLADALASGYEPGMVVIGGLCAGGALVAWRFVSDEPAVAPRIAAPDRGCALPVLDTKETP